MATSKAETKIMKLEKRHIEALAKAESWIFHSDLCPHLELKELLNNKMTPQERERFRYLFIKIYGLNRGGLTKSFIKKYFDIMFDGSIYKDSGQPDYSRILNTLYKFKRKQGDRSLQFSFVSKLVAIHQQSSPLYDTHVLAFFGVKAPAATIDKKIRINWYIDFLDHVRNSYIEWEKDKRLRLLISKIKARDSRLEQFDTVRLMDFLVWNVGNKKLLNK